MAEGTQQHPLKIYFFVWILLFVLSAFSYWVDWYGFQGYSRWGLILLFMMLKGWIHLCHIYASVVGTFAYNFCYSLSLYGHFSICIHNVA